MLYRDGFQKWHLTKVWLSQMEGRNYSLPNEQGREKKSHSCLVNHAGKSACNLPIVKLKTGMRKMAGREVKEEEKWGGGGDAVRCCQTSRRSLHSCHSQAHCASCRAFLLPRLCAGMSATYAAPETACPTRKCWGWSSAWLGACPCCWGGDTQKTCTEQAHRFGKTCRWIYIYYLKLLSLKQSYFTCMSNSC